eukprot:4981592-Prymnesium_polylepis.1
MRQGKGGGRQEGETHAPSGANAVRKGQCRVKAPLAVEPEPGTPPSPMEPPSAGCRGANAGKPQLVCGLRRVRVLPRASVWPAARARGAARACPGSSPSGHTAIVGSSVTPTSRAKCAAAVPCAHKHTGKTPPDHQTGVRHGARGSTPPGVAWRNMNMT